MPIFNVIIEITRLSGFGRLVSKFYIINKVKFDASYSQMLYEYNKILTIIILKS